jgi:virulence factor Mce-like protein
MILAVGLIGMLLSYNANKGLPYVPVYEVSMDFPDAAELVVGGSEVRVQGARVGLVKKITPEPGIGPHGKAFARVRVALDKNLEGIPVDSKVTIRPRSILGAKYIDLVLGKSKKQLPAGGVLSIKQAQPIVELDEAFNVFDRQTTPGLRSTVTSLGDSMAGRGTALNDAIGSAGQLLPPLQRVIRTFDAPSTDVPGFIRGINAFNGALAPVAGSLGSLFDHGATTLAAIDAAGDSLGQTVSELPPTEAVGTSALGKIGPVLDDASAIARAIRPGTRLLPGATRRLSTAIGAGAVTLRQQRGFGNTVRGLVRATRIIDVNRASSTLRNLVATVQTLGSALRTFNPAQVQCNGAGLWARNVPNMASEGDANGAWLTAQTIFSIPGQSLQSPGPSPDLHANPYPNENETECESGNEPYLPGQQIGNPGGDQPNHTQDTAPPAEATALARQAGLLKRSPEDDK